MKQGITTILKNEIHQIWSSDLKGDVMEEFQKDMLKSISEQITQNASVYLQLQTVEQADIGRNQQPQSYAASLT